MDDDNNNPIPEAKQYDCCCGEDCLCSGEDCWRGTCRGDDCAVLMGSEDQADPAVPAEAGGQKKPTADPLAAAQAQADEHLAGWKRAMADYANLKREMERERTEMGKHAAAKLMTDLLPALDSLQRAVAENPFAAVGEAPDADKSTAWANGVGHAAMQFQNALKKMGIEVIDEVGVPFDPRIHDAMMSREAEGKAADLVLEVLQPGYRLGDRVIRAAKVTVSE